MSTVVLSYWCHSDSASVLLYFTFTKTVENDNFSIEKTYAPLPPFGPYKNLFNLNLVSTLVSTAALCHMSYSFCL